MKSGYPEIIINTIPGENQKSPGIDRIPTEFYKTLYEVVENDLIQLYINILLVEKIPQKP